MEVVCLCVIIYIFMEYGQLLWSVPSVKVLMWRAG